MVSHCRVSAWRWASRRRFSSVMSCARALRLAGPKTARNLPVARMKRWEALPLSAVLSLPMKRFLPLTAGYNKCTLMISALTIGGQMTATTATDAEATNPAPDEDLLLEHQLCFALTVAARSVV